MEVMREFVSILQQFDAEISGAQAEAITIYCDGFADFTRFPRMDRGAASWAMVALASSKDSASSLLGVASSAVRLVDTDPFFAGAQHNSNVVAEMTAILESGLWLLQLDVCPLQPATFFSDCLPAGEVIGGKKRASHNVYLAQSARRALTLARSRREVTLEHVPCHAGTLWNEVADRTAKAAIRAPRIGFVRPTVAKMLEDLAPQARGSLLDDTKEMQRSTPDDAARLVEFTDFSER